LLARREWRAAHTKDSGSSEKAHRQREESRETPHGERRGVMQSQPFVAAHWDTDAF